jgi:hypothetical protein
MVIRYQGSPIQALAGGERWGRYLPGVIPGIRPLEVVVEERKKKRLRRGRARLLYPTSVGSVNTHLQFSAAQARANENPPCLPATAA